MRHSWRTRRGGTPTHSTRSAVGKTLRTTSGHTASEHAASEHTASEHTAA